AVTVTRTGNTTGMASVNYATSDTAGESNCNVVSSTASSRCDYQLTVGTLNFAPGETSKTIDVFLVDDSYDETNEAFTMTLSNVRGSGASLGSPSMTTITITDNDATTTANPIDSPNFFVRQHYIDFLNREPDVTGLAFWTNQITSCGSDPPCIEIKRINVSAAFFLSIEFQETGYLVYRFYKSAYGNLPGAPVPLRFNEFLPDTQQIGLGVVVGATGWQAKLEENKKAYAAAFGARPSLASVLPTSLTPAQFVDGLYANAGVASPPAAERTAAIDEFAGAVNTTDTAARGRALRRVAENSTLNQQELNRAFVLMQYYGYLRRNPYDPPEATLDYQGYNFWLGKLNQFNGNYVDAEMVKAFLVSGEYRQRFNE